MSVSPSATELALTSFDGGSLGPYRLVRRLGSGGFAPVWLAEEVHDGKRLRDVAVKLFALPAPLIPGSPDAERWRAGIIAEARALCRVEHPNVVRYLSLQRDDLAGTIGLVMELVSGESLRQRLDEGGPLPARAAIEVGIDVCWALAAVHAAGLVHRDVKPANIVRGARGHMLIDFGIVAPLAAAQRGAAGLDAARDEATRDTFASPSAETRELSERSSESLVALAGTPGYVAPECLAAGGPSGSPGADLYALGVTLFTLVVGARPDALADAATRPVTVGARRGPAPRVEALLGDRSPDLLALGEVIASLLIADPGARARHADAVARRLEQIRDTLASGPRTPITARLGAPRPAILALPVPAPLAPSFARASAADPRADPASTARLFGELGLGIVRYAVAAGLALLAAEEITPSAALAEALSEARPTAASWCRVAQAVARALAAARPLDAPRFAFLAGDRPIEALSELVRVGPAGLAEALAHLDEAFTPARDLLAITALPAAPWLPILEGRVMLPEAPRGPGLPFRATDPERGERHDAPALDAALRRFLGDDSDVEPPRSTFLRQLPIEGRGAELLTLDRLAAAALGGRVGFALITGPLGIGRTRLLDAAVAQLGLAPPRVLRFTCSPERRSPLRPLVRAIEALPDNSAFGQLADAIDRALLPRALGPGDGGLEGLEDIEDALLWTSADEPVLLAADDVQWADAHTLGVLRLLVERAAAGASGKLLVLAAARDEPSPSAELRKLRSAARRGLRSGVKQLALEPLADDDAARLVRLMGPVDATVEDAVLRGAGGVPFLILHALAAWREAGALVLRGGVLTAAGALPLPCVPGVADLLEARLDACFEPSSAAGKAALRALAAVAIHGGGLRADLLLPLLGDEGAADEALEALVDAGILTAGGDGPEHGFAQEMVRQAALNLVRRRPWFGRLSRALLDALALGGGDDAAFLAEGYEKLGATEPARRFRRKALGEAADAGLFDEAAEHGDRLAALAETETERRDTALVVIAALVKGRRFRDARRRLDRLDVPPRSAADIRRRILALQVIHGLAEPAADDPTLLPDADALGEATLACEARLALAGVAGAARARALLDEAVERAQAVGAALELSARVQRFDLTYATDHCDLSLAERDLTRALVLSLSPGVAPPWQRLHLQGSLVVVEAELGRLDDALARLRALIAEAEARGMRSYVRLYTLNLAAFLLRAGAHADAAAAAERAQKLAEIAADAHFQASALSIRAASLGALGRLDDALRCADEAERLQRERKDRLQALTLLRRASILEALSRPADALRDARQARSIAERDRDADLVISAQVWEQLHLLRAGEGDRATLEHTVTEAEASGVLLRGFSLLVIEQAKALLASTRTG
jgi:serine/threonine protein kinase/tetratricopeptide (TPR) repeat protein